MCWGLNFILPFIGRRWCGTLFLQWGRKDILCAVINRILRYTSLFPPVCADMYVYLFTWASVLC